MKLKVWIAVLSFLTIVNLTAVVAFLVHQVPRDTPESEFLGRRPPFMGQGPHRFPSEDRERLRTLIHEFHEETQDLRDRTRELEDDIMNLMREERVDREALDSLLAQLSGVRLEMSKRATDRMLEAKAFLTPEQQEMFYRAILRGRPGGGPGGPPGRHRPRPH